MKEGTKTGDVVGRPSGRWLFLGDPGTLFFYGKLGTGTKKEKRSKKERKRRPVETDAADGNPLTTRIPTAAWKAQNAFHSSHKARRRFYRRDLIHQQGGAKSNDQKGPNQVDGSNLSRQTQFLQQRPSEEGVMHIFVSTRGSLCRISVGTRLCTNCARTDCFQPIGVSF